MPPAWEDLSVFFDAADFADLATFTTSGGQVIADVPGIFDEPVLNAETGEYDMAVSMPRFCCELSHVSALKKHDTARINGVTYMLDHDPHADGTGLALLELSRDFGA